MASTRAYITEASVQQTAVCHMSTVIGVSCIASSDGTACAVNLNPINMRNEALWHPKRRRPYTGLPLRNLSRHITGIVSAGVSLLE